MMTDLIGEIWGQYIELDRLDDRSCLDNVAITDEEAKDGGIETDILTRDFPIFVGKTGI